MDILEACVAGDLEELKKCIQAGADVNTVNESGESILLISAYIGNTETIQLLLDAGANVNLCDKNACTPLHAAAIQLADDEHRNCDRNIQLLLTANANPNAQTNRGLTPLHLAADGVPNPKSISYLLEAGADPTLFDDEELRPEDVAVNEAVKSQIREHRIAQEKLELLQIANGIAPEAPEREPHGMGRGGR